MIVLIAVDHVLVYEGLARILQEHSGLEPVPSTGNIEDAPRADVALIQGALGNPGVLDVIRSLRSTQPEAAIIVLASAEDDNLFLSALREGAKGFLDSDSNSDALLQAITNVANGKFAIAGRFADRLAMEYIAGTARPNPHETSGPESVTDREHEVLRLVSSGLTNKEVARRLFLSESTVRAHVRSIILKLSAENRVHAVRRAIDLGVLSRRTDRTSPADAQSLSA